jgi:glycosyltransferase involved in cell wall biosynthesis
MIVGIDASRATTLQRTGTEHYAYQLIQALIPLARAGGHQLRLYFNQAPAPGLFAEAAHVTLHPIPFPRLWTHARLATELRRQPPDVFFTPAHVIPFTWRGRSVATVHDLGYHYFPQAHTRRQLAYLRWSTALNARRSRRLIADSQTTAADLARFYQADRKKIVVVYPGLAPIAAVTDPRRLAAARQQYGLAERYLLYIGTLQPRKNLGRLVRAYAIYASGNDAAPQLVLAGRPGWLAQTILDEIARLPLPVRERIHLTGFVAEADKAALLSGAVALLFPSLYEGFGFPVLEAQACGLPVLGANSSSLPEVAGEAALLVDPLDTGALAAAIERIVNDEPLRRELIARGPANAARFTWGKAAAQALAVLEEAAGD